MGIETWRTIVLTIAAIGQTVFVLLYLTFRWWSTFLGRALFGNAFALALALDAIAVARLIHRGHDNVSFVVLYALLALGVWAQSIAFIRVQIHGGVNPHE